MKLIVEPNPILMQIAEDWLFDLDNNAEQIETDMLAIMKMFNGIGLAGNQVGLLKRVFTIKLNNHPDLTEPFAMFNPKVVSQNDSQQMAQEGCLSFPELWLDVKRPTAIEVEYFDKLGNQCIINLTGIDARCFLHELDHLNGIVFTEKISPLKLMVARKKQRKYNGRTK